MAKRKIRIEADPTPEKQWCFQYWHIYVDDVEITKYVRAIDAHIVVGDVPQVTLHLIGELELPPILAELTTVINVLPDGEITNIGSRSRQYQGTQKQKELE